MKIFGFSIYIFFYSLISSADAGVSAYFNFQAGLGGPTNNCYYSPVLASSCVQTPRAPYSNSSYVLKSNVKSTSASSALDNYYSNKTSSKATKPGKEKPLERVSSAPPPQAAAADGEAVTINVGQASIQAGDMSGGKKIYTSYSEVAPSQTSSAVSGGTRKVYSSYTEEAPAPTSVFTSSTPTRSARKVYESYYDDTPAAASSSSAYTTGSPISGRQKRYESYVEEAPPVAAETSFQVSPVPGPAAGDEANVQTVPASAPSVESRTIAPQPPAPEDVDMMARNRKLLEGCPTCELEVAKKDRDLMGRREILSHLPRVDSLLKSAAHNVMRVAHMNCDADRITVPANYISDMNYCADIHNPTCDRAALPVSVVYTSVELEKYKRDQQTGDVYRTPTSPGASKRCEDLHSRPVIFHVGGKATFSRSKNSSELNLFHGAIPTFDCGSTINTIFCAAGLKLSPKDSSCSTSTSEMIRLSKDASSCIKPVNFNAQESLHAGDVFVLNRKVRGGDDHNHAMMFDEVGEDPFGLVKSNVQTEEDCSTKIAAQNFNFTIVQSSGSDVDRQVFERFNGADLFIPQNSERFKPSNVPCSADHPNGCDLRSRFEDWGVHILEMARLACVAKVKNRALSPTVVREREGETTKVKGKEVQAYAGGVLFRHKGLDSPNCSFPTKPKLTGSECLGGCLDQ